MSTLVWNQTGENHLLCIQRLFEGATHFDCTVAFLKHSGLRLIFSHLKDFLRSGGTARFIVGLDFCLTDPNALGALLELPVELFAVDGGGARAFHPKVYHFVYPDRTETLIGSANLTGGGLQSNYECSLHVIDEHKKLLRTHLTRMLSDEDLSPFTADDLLDYRERHRIARISRATEMRQYSRLTSATSGIEQLKIILEEYRADTTEHGFLRQTKWRRWAAAEVENRIREIAKVRQTRSSVLQHYDFFLAHFASAIRRSYQSDIAGNPIGFRKVIRLGLESRKSTPQGAYNSMIETGVLGMGPNWITEILSALNAKRFAVLNRNSLEGMRAVFPDLPATPNYSPSKYQEFCDKGRELAAALNLVDLRELDALFSRMYFSTRN